MVGKKGRKRENNGANDRTMKKWGTTTEKPEAGRAATIRVHPTADASEVIVV
jgi:hypothetical protein